MSRVTLRAQRSRLARPDGAKPPKGKPAAPAFLRVPVRAVVELLAGQRVPAAAPARDVYAFRLDEGRPLQLSAPAADDATTWRSWAPEVRAHLAQALNVPARRLHLVSPREGRSGDLVFMVFHRRQPLGVLKVFRSEARADAELAHLKLLQKQPFQRYLAVELRGSAPVHAGDARYMAVMMEMADRGRTLGKEISGLPGQRQVARRVGEAMVASARFGLPLPLRSRAAQLVEVGRKLELLGQALAELHTRFEDGRMLSAEAKAEIVGRLRAALRELRQPNAGASFSARWLREHPQARVELLRVEQALNAQLIPEFLRAPLRATLPHNDAHLGNYTVRRGTVRTFDFATMGYSRLADGSVDGTALSDVGRLAQSLHSWPRRDGAPSLTREEACALDGQLIRAYAAAKGQDPIALDRATTLQRVQFELAVLRFATSDGEAQGAIDELARLMG